MSAVTRVARWYDTSSRGRRLAESLDRALIDTTPARWRTGQLLSVIAIAGALVIFGAPPLVSLSAGSVAGRGGGRMMLRARRHRRRHALDAAAPALARAIASQMRTGRSAATAIRGLPEGDVARDHPVLRRPLNIAARRVALGEPAGQALATALGAERGESASRRDGGPPGLSRVCALTELIAVHGGSIDALTTLAGILDENRRIRDTVRALIAEPRVAAVAVPALALATTVPLLAGDRSALAVALSMPEIGIETLCALIATAGIVIVRRLTRPQPA